MRHAFFSSALAALLASSAARADTPTAPESENADATRGWIGVGGRNSIGISPVDPDFGVYAYGGYWTLNEHFQPFFRAGWSEASSGSATQKLVIESVRAGGGILAGAATAGGHLWLGAGGGVEGIVGFAHGDGAANTTAGAAIPLVFVLQGRVARRILLGIDLGPEIFPGTLTFRSVHEAMEWGPFRLNGGLLLGVILGDAVGDEAR
jgi:hypothetical protein